MLHRFIASRAPLPGFPWPRPEWPVAFVNVRHSREESEGTSKINRMEAEVRTLKATRFPSDADFLVVPVPHSLVVIGVL